MYTAMADAYIFQKILGKEVNDVKTFFNGVMMGAVVGVAVSAAMLQQMRPDVTRRMIRDGKHMLKMHRSKMHV